MKKLNCWEFKKCGREPGGYYARQLGVCPAAVDAKTDGVNNGLNGGRACWFVAGTYSPGNAEDNLPNKLTDCRDCRFFKLVMAEEGNNVIKTIVDMKEI